MLTSFFVYLAVVGSAPLLSGAKPLFNGITVTLTATVTQTRTIVRCPSASPDSVNVGLPIPAIAVLPTPVPAGNVVADVLSGTSSLVGDVFALSSGSAGGSQILPTGSLSSALAVPTDATASVLEFINGVDTKLGAANTAVLRLSTTLASVTNPVGNVLEQLATSVDSLTSTFESVSDALGTLTAGVSPLSPSSGANANRIHDASLKVAKKIEALAKQLEMTASTIPKGADSSQLRAAVQAMKSDWTNASTALKVQCPDAMKRQVFATAAATANAALDRCLLNLNM
ncbi:hypothetical protein C8R46DRAFT_1186664 [Mycena filopes]|nr:hypothetical protein C8R46DRAFT_1186664 [Mycena filopes]